MLAKKKKIYTADRIKWTLTSTEKVLLNKIAIRKVLRANVLFQNEKDCSMHCNYKEYDRLVESPLYFIHGQGRRMKTEYLVRTAQTASPFRSEVS